MPRRPRFRRRRLRLDRVYRALRPIRRRLRPYRLHLWLFAALAVSGWVGVNAAVRAAGGSVSLLSVRHFSTRVHALSLRGVHRITCHCDELSPVVELRAAARRHGVSPRLAVSVARVESSLVHDRISGVGAMGLMQIMPATARGLGIADPFDLRANADGGVRYLKELLRWYRGNVRRAVAAYNAGVGRVARRGKLSLPPETRVYVRRVLARL